MAQRGDSFFDTWTADAYNRFNTVAKAYQEGRLQPRSSTFSTPTLDIKNATEEDLPAHSVLGISGVASGPDDDLDNFRFATLPTGITPSADDHKGRFAVLLESVDAGKVGEAAVSGLVVCKVNIVTEGDSFADIKDGDNTQLESGASGCRILAAESGTGTRWCLVFLGNTAGDVFWQFTLTENMGATTSNEASATLLNIDGTTTGETATMLDTTPNSMWEPLTSGSSGWCFERGGEYHIIQAECHDGGGSDTSGLAPFYQAFKVF